MRRHLLAVTIACVSVAVAAPTFADSAPGAAGPTMDQIYQAASSGHLDQAQQMISQVLADHPESYKAHFVQAELYAKEGKTPLARSELGVAEHLNPALPAFSSTAVRELKSQLGLAPTPRALGAREIAAPAGPGLHFPWGTLLILGIAAVVLMMLFRRRSYAQYPAQGAGMGGAPGTYGPGYGPAPMGGGGIGSGIAGGLASGLAVGAGVVAGEELAHHFLDGGQRSGGVIPSADAAEGGFGNSDMGGADFGSNDSGGGWDDGGGGGGGGDWS